MSSLADKGSFSTLLKWCQSQLIDYPGITIIDFTTSWKDGKAFCYLIHRFRPDLIDIASLEGTAPIENINIALQTAEEDLGVPNLLKLEDFIDRDTPDKLSIFTYVSQIYNCFKDAHSNGGPLVNSYIKKNKSISRVKSDHLDSFVGSTGNSHPSTPGSTSGSKNTCTICEEHIDFLERFSSAGLAYHRNCFRASQLSHIDRKIQTLGSAITAASIRQAHFDFTGVDGISPPTLDTNGGIGKSRSCASLRCVSPDTSSSLKSPNSATSGDLSSPRSLDNSFTNGGLLVPGSPVHQHIEITDDHVSPSTDNPLLCDDTLDTKNVVAVPPLPNEPTELNNDNNTQMDSAETSSPLIVPSVVHIEQSDTNLEQHDEIESKSQNTLEICSTDVTTTDSNHNAIQTPDSPTPPALTTSTLKIREGDSSQFCRSITSTPSGSPSSIRRSKRRAPAPPGVPKTKTTNGSIPPTTSCSASVSHKPSHKAPLPPKLDTSRVTKHGGQKESAETPYYPDDLNPFAFDEEEEKVIDSKNKPNSKGPPRPAHGPIQHSKEEHKSPPHSCHPSKSSNLPEHDDTRVDFVYKGTNPFDDFGDEEEELPITKHNSPLSHAGKPVANAKSSNPFDDENEASSPVRSPVAAAGGSDAAALSPSKSGLYPSLSNLSTTSSMYKKRRAPAPPPMAAQMNVGRAATAQRPRDLYQLTGSTRSSSVSSLSRHATKRLAPALPPAPKRDVRAEGSSSVKIYEQSRKELNQLNEAQSRIEKEAKAVQEKLWKADDQSAEFEALVTQWLKLVADKGELFRKENELALKIEQQELEDEHAELEYKLRFLTSKQDAQKSAAEKAEEAQLLEKLVQTVDARARIVDVEDQEHSKKTKENKKEHVGGKFKNMLCIGCKINKNHRHSDSTKPKKKKSSQSK